MQALNSGLIHAIRADADFPVVAYSRTFQGEELFSECFVVGLHAVCGNDYWCFLGYCLDILEVRARVLNISVRIHIACQEKPSIRIYCVKVVSDLAFAFHEHFVCVELS